ncbi:MAG: hypothetical protein AB8D52_03525 [Gammaproteobacteria bacterium]
MRFFAHNDRETEQRFFGLGQFVLLLTLVPFILSLSLYTFNNTNPVASQYQYDPQRFIPLSYPPAIMKISAKKKGSFNAADICLGLFVPKFRKACMQYREDLKQYTEEKTKLENGSYHDLELPPVSVLSESRFSFNALIEKVAIISSWQLINDPIWFIGLLLIFPTVWLCIKRKQWGLLIFGLSIPAYNYIIFIAAFFLKSPDLFDWQLKQVIFAQIAFIWFLINGQIRSKSMGLFILCLSLFAFLPEVTNFSKDLFLQNDGYEAVNAQLPIVIFLMVAVLGRLFVKGAKENYYLLNNMGLAKSLRSFLHSLALWTPLGIIALSSLYLFEVFIPRHFITQLHENSILKHGYEHDLLDNALLSTATKADSSLYSWYVSIEKTKIDIREKRDQIDSSDITANIMASFNEIVPPKLDIERKKTGVPLIGWAIDIGVKKSQDSISDAFENRHNKLTENLSTFVKAREEELKNEILKPGAEKSLKVSNEIYEKGKQTILASNREAQSTLWWWINFIRAIQQILFLLFVFACIQSLLYVFSRVSFSRQAGHFITLGDSRLSVDKIQTAKIKSTGLDYEINSDQEETFYISRRFQCRGKAPKLSVPQLFRAFFARLFSRSLTMNKIVIQKGDDTVSCSAIQGMQFYEWQLAENETVIFKFKNFVGYSGDIEISTLISPRISSLILGKVIYSQVTGPGKLILMAKGRADITNKENTGGSLPPDRIIAMQKEARLHVESELDPVNIYFSTAYVHPIEGSMIVDVDTHQGAISGLGGFFRRFILPV